MSFMIHAHDLQVVLDRLLGSISKSDIEKKHLLFMSNKDRGVLTIQAGTLKEIYRLHSSELELKTRTSIPIFKADKDCYLQLPVSKIVGLIKNFKDTTFLFEPNGDTCLVTPNETGTSVLLRDTYPADFPIYDMSGAVAIQREGFLRAMEFVLPAMSADVTRSGILGVEISSDRIMGSNGSLLMAHHFPSGLPRLHFSDKTTRQIIRQLGLHKAVQEIKVKWIDPYLVIEIGPTHLIAKQHSGNFNPKALAIMEKAKNENKFRLCFKSSAILNAILAIKLNADIPEERLAVFTINKDHVVIKPSAGKDRTQAEFKVESWDGPADYQIILLCDRIETVVNAMVAEKREGLLVFRFHESNMLPVFIEEGAKTALLMPGNPRKLQGSSDHRDAKIIVEKVAESTRAQVNADQKSDAKVESSGAVAPVGSEVSKILGEDQQGGNKL